MGFLQLCLLLVDIEIEESGRSDMGEDQDQRSNEIEVVEWTKALID